MLSTKPIGCILATTLMIVAGCQKTNNDPSQENQLQASVTQNAADVYDVQTGEDGISNDVNAAVAVNPSFSANGIVLNDSAAIQGAVIDNSELTVSVKKIKIVYDGSTVLGVVRSGIITVELIQGTSWRDAGAVLVINFDNVRVSTAGKTFIYNGTCHMTNVSGGLPYISGTDPVIQTVRVNGTVTFDDNSTLTWWAARKYSFSLASTDWKCEGDTVINGESCTMGGRNRFDTDFLVKAPEPIVSDLTCGIDKPVSGKRVFTAAGRDTYITFGVNNTGTPVSPGNCAYGYKLEWTTWWGQDATLIVPY